MSDRSDRHELDILEQATAELRDVPIPPGPSLGVTASLVETLNASNTPPDTVRLPERKHRMFTLVRVYAAAAALMLAMLGGTFWVMDRSASLTYAQVVENVKKAATAQFVVKQKFGDRPALQSKIALKSHFLRLELQDLLVIIYDIERKTGLQLDVHRKIATKLDLDHADLQMFKEPIELLRRLKEEIKEQVDQLTDDEVDGHKCHVYQVKTRLKKGTAPLLPDRFKLWADVKSGLPVKIEAKDEHTSLVFEQFRWDDALEENLFSLKAPVGYQTEELIAAAVEPNRIYYQQGYVELFSVQPDGKKPESQFVPRSVNVQQVYNSDKAALSPDARYLAIGYTYTDDKGAYPPNKIFLWDRTQPKAPLVEIYTRPNGELQSWQFSADGSRLYVSWWEGVPTRRGPDSRTGTDVVDLATKATQTLKLPTFEDADGKQKTMYFGTALADGRTFLVIGDGLHLASSEGKLLQRLCPAEVRSIENVRVSPDGGQVLYVTFNASDRSRQLFTVPMAGGVPKAMVPAGKLTNIRASWSPDGKKIAYTCRLLDPSHAPFNYGKETYLKTVDADGSHEVTVLTKKVDPRETGFELTAWR